MRFNRDYELVMRIGNQALIVKPPIRITFSCDKTISGTLNKSKLTIYNLKESTRLALVKDPEQVKKIAIGLSIGYENRLERLFSGDVYRGYNRRQGAEYITSLEIYDGGYDFFNSFTSKTVRTKEQAINSILEDMPNTNKGKFTEMSQMARPKVLVGNSYKLIDELIGDDENYYIDNGQLFITKNKEVTTSYIPLVTAKTGLLNTPQREQQKVTFETMMNPSLRIGNLCALQCVTAPHLNGNYKIESISYTGDTDGQDWRQTVTGYLASSYKVI